MHLRLRLEYNVHIARETSLAHFRALSGNSGLPPPPKMGAFAYTNLSMNFLDVNAILISVFDGSSFLCRADLAKKIFIYELP